MAGKRKWRIIKANDRGGFYNFITFDNNLSFQQNFSNYPLQVVVLVAKDNTYETIMEFFPAVIEKIKQSYT